MSEPDDAFAAAYSRFEIELNLAHRRIEALERENAELRIKNHRLMRDFALAKIRGSAGGTPQSSASQTPPPSSQEDAAADRDSTVSK